MDSKSKTGAKGKEKLEENQLVDLISKQLKIEKYNPELHKPDPELKSLIAGETARKMRVVPLQKKDKLLIIAMSDPIDIRTLDKVEIMTKLDVEPVICTEQSLNQLAQAVYGMTFNFTEMVSSMEDADEANVEEEEGAASDEFTIGSLTDMAQEAPVIRMANSILIQAVRAKASDVHISPEKDRVQLRFRVDGVMSEVPAPPKVHFMPLISRLKLLANMDISVSRIPQDGRFTFRTAEQEVSVRASSLPTIYGENMVLRLLRQSSGGGLSLDDLGMAKAERDKFERGVKKPYGMVLATGPTGSGKSTLLYALLKRINKPEINIITLEDPVEYRMPGIRQVQLNRKAGMTFASGLRSILRQDPDVIMVGEIRDTETAEIAIESALTGHLVLSTLHTNTAAGAVTRFVEMGIEPYLISSTLLVAGAQRLVRRICPHCVEPYEPPVEAMTTMDLEPVEGALFLEGKGCIHCNQSGFLGRVGIYEILEVGEEIQDLIVAGAATNEITRKATELGVLRTLKMDAADKVLRGITTLDEAAKVVLA